MEKIKEPTIFGFYIDWFSFYKEGNKMSNTTNRHIDWYSNHPKSVHCFNFTLHTGWYRKTRLTSEFNQRIWKCRLCCQQPSGNFKKAIVSYFTGIKTGLKLLFGCFFKNLEHFLGFPANRPKNEKKLIL